MVDPKAKKKKVSMVQQFFADIESTAEDGGIVPVHQNGDILDGGRKKSRPHSIEAGLAAVATAFVEPMQVKINLF